MATKIFDHGFFGFCKRWALYFVQARIVHFVVLGGLIFALAPKNDTDKIFIAKSDLESVQMAEARRMGLPALPKQKLEEIVSRLVEDELLYREALRLGLDKDDHIVRQRLIQKVLILAQDLGRSDSPPTDTNLKAYFEKHPKRWMQLSAVGLSHIFISNEHTAMVPSIRQKLSKVGDANSQSFLSLGDAFPLSRVIPPTPMRRIADDYGADFAEAIKKMPIGVWSGPIQSKFGWHFVKVNERSDSRPKDFAEAKREIASDFMNDTKSNSIQSYLEGLQKRYKVEVEGYPGFSIVERFHQKAEDEANGED